MIPGHAKTRTPGHRRTQVRKKVCSSHGTQCRWIRYFHAHPPVNACEKHRLPDAEWILRKAGLRPRNDPTIALAQWRAQPQRNNSPSGHASDGAAIGSNVALQPQRFAQCRPALPGNSASTNMHHHEGAANLVHCRGSVRIDRSRPRSASRQGRAIAKERPPRREARNSKRCKRSISAPGAVNPPLRQW